MNQTGYEHVHDYRYLPVLLLTCYYLTVVTYLPVVTYECRPNLHVKKMMTDETPVIY